MKTQPDGPGKKGGGGGLFLRSQEDQDLCASADVEEHIFKTSSGSSNKFVTKDFLSGFRHDFTEDGEQEDVRLTCRCTCIC